MSVRCVTPALSGLGFDVARIAVWFIVAGVIWGRGHVEAPPERLPDEAPSIITASYFTPIPPDVQRIGISRGLPRGLREYRRYRKLAPGPWFRSAPARVYLDLYTKQLAGLDPARVVDELEAIADGRTAALCCFESAHEIGLSRRFCHRHIAARWLEDRIGIEVPELGAPADFDPWGVLRRLKIDPPSFVL